MIVRDAVSAVPQNAGTKGSRIHHRDDPVPRSAAHIHHHVPYVVLVDALHVAPRELELPSARVCVHHHRATLRLACQRVRCLDPLTFLVSSKRAAVPLRFVGRHPEAEVFLQLRLHGEDEHPVAFTIVSAQILFLVLSLPPLFQALLLQLVQEQFLQPLRCPGARAGLLRLRFLRLEVLAPLPEPVR